MVLHRAHTMSAAYSHFACRTYKKYGAETCTGHYVRECVLDEVILEDLRWVTAMAREHTQEFAEYISGRQSGETKREIPQAGEGTDCCTKAERRTDSYL